MNKNFDDKTKLIETYEDKGLNKGTVIDVLAGFVINNDFVRILESFLKEDVERANYSGVVYSDEFDIDDEYFGENKVLFYYGVGEIREDIVTHKELCEYLEEASEFYISNHPEKTNEVDFFISEIKEKYNVN